MIKTIKIYDDKSIYPSDLIIGNEGEKGVNTLNFDIETNIPSMKWYLIFDNKAYPINNNKLVVNETMTIKGVHICYVVGSDARPGQKINEGTLYFRTNKIIMRVGE